ncbi:uncharacterized protein LOC109723871 isoform X4 [Ananas comosus]|uniref:Uncharacterized protein LOC109723871 isoform X4 n=1 Tax=Ananas comosus TaxID=4615 RepID=A0A6P5GR67_ANACO|nr:uncharacterized protein LOC109723871 isoform X4 [Ananas comosus]
MEIGCFKSKRNGIRVSCSGFDAAITNAKANALDLNCQVCAAASGIGRWRVVCALMSQQFLLVMMFILMVKSATLDT